MDNNELEKKHYQEIWHEQLRAANLQMRISFRLADENHPSKAKYHAKQAITCYQIAEYFYNLFLHS